MATGTADRPFDRDNCMRCRGQPSDEIRQNTTGAHLSSLRRTGESQHAQTVAASKSAQATTQEDTTYRTCVLEYCTGSSVMRARRRTSVPVLKMGGLSAPGSRLRARQMNDGGPRKEGAAFSVCRSPSSSHHHACRPHRFPLDSPGIPAFSRHYTIEEPTDGTGRESVSVQRSTRQAASPHAHLPSTDASATVAIAS